MRRALATLISAVVVGLMLVPSCTSAGSKTAYADDSTGDIGFGWSSRTGEIMPVWGPGRPWATTGYLDLAAARFSQKGDTYTFGLELAAALPIEGTALCTAVQHVEWGLWINPSPWNYSTNPVPVLFKMALMYDGYEYSAGLWDYTTGAPVAPLPFAVDGARLQVTFLAASIGNLASFWWEPTVRIWQGLYGSVGYSFLDAIDWGSAPGQVYYDFPWSP